MEVDVIIIGTGFGASVAVTKLLEKLSCVFDEGIIGFDHRQHVHHTSGVIGSWPILNRLFLRIVFVLID
jgi:hypothetical protein